MYFESLIVALARSSAQALNAEYIYTCIYIYIHTYICGERVAIHICIYIYFESLIGALARSSAQVYVCVHIVHIHVLQYMYVYI